MAKRKKQTKKKQNKSGAPTKKTTEIVDILLKCLTAGFHVETACGYAKINKTTFYNWLEKDRDFSTQVAYAKAGAVMRLAQAVERDDPWKILKNIAPKLYRDKIEFQREADSTVIFNVGDAKKLYDV